MAIEQAISERELAGFENLLSSVNLEQLDITPYAKRYLQHILNHKKYYCRIYAHLLNLALQTPSAVKKPGGGSLTKRLSKKDISLVDYGAGNGMMGLLAKYCGFGKIYINDLNAGFLEAAKKLSQAIGVLPDGFIEGDIEQVKTAFENSSLDVIVGTDVIEHIYSLEHFFKTIKEINPAMVTVMSTACNAANAFKVREVKKLQIKDELYGGSPGDHALFGETAIEPFIETRKKIITVFAGDKLAVEEISKLAILTRGLRKNDIEKAVENYIVEKVWPVLISHATNTCDPITGSWSERLLSFDEYKTIYTDAGFGVEFYNGFYNEYESTFKSRLLYFVNKLIPFTGYRVSPFITIVGKPKF